MVGNFQTGNVQIAARLTGSLIETVSMRDIPTRSRAVGLALCCATALAGCGMFSGPSRLKLGDVRVRAAPDANRNSPVVMDVVLVSDAALEQRLMAPDGKWFPAGPSLVASYPQALRVYHCEFPPSSELALPREMFDGQRALAVFVFAGLADGEQRARIEGWRDGGVITVARDGWSATPQETGTPAQRPPPAMHCSSQT
jgi:type VI secretion system protein